jgi:hypothetical protein
MAKLGLERTRDCKVQNAKCKVRMESGSDARCLDRGASQLRRSDEGGVGATAGEGLPRLASSSVRNQDVGWGIIWGLGTTRANIDHPGQMAIGANAPAEVLLYGRTAVSPAGFSRENVAVRQDAEPSPSAELMPTALVKITNPVHIGAGLTNLGTSSACRSVSQSHRSHGKRAARGPTQTRPVPSPRAGQHSQVVIHGGKRW